MVRPVALIELDPQATELKAPQDPENNWTRLLLELDETVIVGFVEFATKLYQTSTLLAPTVPQPGEGIVV
jgi:hypothetical protein